MNRNFNQLLQARWDEGKFVCVGLDPEYEKIPACLQNGTPDSSIISFNKAIVDATKDLVCAYKPNSAFYEALGLSGTAVLEATIGYIRKEVPGIPVILDAKRADIGNTNNGYVRSAFEKLGADAITVHPYLGQEALQPFLDQKDKGIIVLCKTSNKGAGEFQDLWVPIEAEELAHLRNVRAVPHSSSGICGNYTSLSNHVAYRISRSWNKNSNCAIVAGATFPEELESIRSIVGDMPILIPGIGAQGGDVEKTVKAGKDSRGRGMIINSSRGIIYASNGEDFAQAARRETVRLSEEINKHRQ